MAQGQPQGQAQGPDIFDRMAAQAAGVEPPQSLSKEELPALAESAFSAQNASKTPPNVRQALQFLLAHGWIESATKPKLFQLIAAHVVYQHAQVQRLQQRIEQRGVRRNQLEQLGLGGRFDPAVCQQKL